MRLVSIILFVLTGCFAAQLQAAATTTPAAATTAQVKATATRPAVARPTQEVPQASCVTAECHADVKNYKVLHGPVNVNACDSCHTLVDAKAHTFKLARAERDLCTFCHEMNLADAPVVHKPVMDGQCSSCHNPHGGKARSMTRGASVRDVCISCHNNGAAGMKYVHGPVASGACDSCHTSHKSNFKKLLNTEGNDLCFQCHGEMRRQLGEAKVKHKAVEGSCLNCHDAHASNFVMQTKQPAKELCLSCHQKNLQTALSSKFVHQPVVDDKACLNCHTAHGGMIAALMKDEPAKLCVGCHKTPQKTPDGRKINSVAEIADPKLVKHGPIREGDCSGCHSTHGSNVEKLLAKPYPAAFYQPYSDDKYALCFSCHDKQLVQTPEAHGLTNFRNGDMNLHFLHVNREKGRNCRSCHDTHASVNELHIRESVPFGNWQMPISFKKTPTGGGCSPGCHQPYEYDRQNPKAYDATPQPQPAAKER